MTLVEHGALQDHAAPVDGGGSIGTGDIAHCGRGLEHLPVELMLEVVPFGYRDRRVSARKRKSESGCAS